LAKELVALQPDVILAQTTPAVVALQRETRTIPIVFVGVADAVGAGLVTSLARPDGNTTGFMLFEARHRQASGWQCSRRSRHGWSEPLS